MRDVGDRDHEAPAAAVHFVDRDRIVVVLRIDGIDRHREHRAQVGAALEVRIGRFAECLRGSDDVFREFLLDAVKACGGGVS